jgi:hypothetical protein
MNAIGYNKQTKKCLSDKIYGIYKTYTSLSLFFFFFLSTPILRRKEGGGIYWSGREMYIEKCYKGEI